MPNPNVNRRALRGPVGSSIPAGLYNGLIHAWMMNEGSGATVPDRVGGQSLTLQNGASWTTQDGMTCINLSSGSSQYLDTAAWSVGANNVTLVGWFWQTSGLVQSMLIEKETVNTQWEILYNLGGPFLRGGGTNGPSISSSPSTSAWHMISGTINGTAGVIYVDDGVASNASATVDAFTDTSSALEIGRFNSGFYLNGKVAPVYIYNRALSATEIAQLYAAVYLF